MMLNVQGLSIEFKTENGILNAVCGVDLAVEHGEALGIVGESGCGKSVTMMGFLSLLPKTARRKADRIEFDGKDLIGISPRGMRPLLGNDIGVIFQDPMTALNPTYTIGNQLTEVYLKHRSASRKEAKERAIHLLDRVGITAAKSRLTQYPHQLSGGLRQRIMIAQALMCEPQLIIADEPTTALDVTVQAQILWLLKDIQSEIRASVILITHDLGVVAQMTDRVSVMYAGQIVESGQTTDVFSAPKHPYTRGLLSCIPGARHQGRLGQIHGIVPSLIGATPRGCVFRTRCPVATEACRTDIPHRKSGNDHSWRCTLSSAEGVWQ